MSVFIAAPMIPLLPAPDANGFFFFPTIAAECRRFQRFVFKLKTIASAFQFCDSFVACFERFDGHMQQLAIEFALRYEQVPENQIKGPSRVLGSKYGLDHVVSVHDSLLWLSIKASLTLSNV
jgi:hypothetical protein